MLWSDHYTFTLYYLLLCAMCICIHIMIHTRRWDCLYIYQFRNWFVFNYWTLYTIHTGILYSMKITSCNICPKFNQYSLHIRSVMCLLQLLYDNLRPRAQLFMNQLTSFTYIWTLTWNVLSSKALSSFSSQWAAEAAESTKLNMIYLTTKSSRKAQWANRVLDRQQRALTNLSAFQSLKLLFYPQKLNNSSFEH